MAGKFCVPLPDLCGGQEHTYPSIISSVTGSNEQLLMVGRKPSIRKLTRIEVKSSFGESLSHIVMLGTFLSFLIFLFLFLYCFFLILQVLCVYIMASSLVFLWDY